ncbi:MAG: hypothetical protein HY063_10445 [Bacteroidetes bacterium]|nr:hypothetical protein [Bacteroidota bacterium]
MKKIFTTLFIASIFTVHAQTPGACGKHNSEPIPYNGNGSLGPAYSATACGLNYVFDSTLVETRFNTYTTAGNYGSGLPAKWNISGLPASYVVDKAFVWALVSYQSATAPASTVTITNPASGISNFSASPAGTDGPKCWGETGTAVYRYDVTPSVVGNGIYTFNFSGFSNPNWEIDGATLFI